MEQASNTPPKSIEDFLRFHSKGLLDTIGRFFLKLGVHPNTVTIIGLVGNFIGAGYWPSAILRLADLLCCSAVRWMLWTVLWLV